jgi:hypothetical protein
MHVAVHNLQAQGIEEASAVLISDRLRSELFATGAFTVLERGQMEEILKEQGFQQAGCLSDACVVEVGQLLGVGQMITGSIGKVGKTYTLNARVIDVKTGQITNSVNTDCKCPIDDVLSKSTKELAGMLAAPIEQGTATGEQEPVPGVEAEAGKEKRKHNRKLRITMQVACGAVALAGGVVGILMNQQAQEKIDEAAAVEKETTSANFDESAAAYSSAYGEAEDSMLLRNISYAVAGVGVVGFGISFAF